MTHEDFTDKGHCTLPPEEVFKIMGYLKTFKAPSSLDRQDI